MLFKKWVMCSLFFFFSAVVFAQSKKVSGKVTGANGAAVVGASVQVKGTNNITATSEEGTFSIDVAPGRNTLLISSVGFESREFPVGNGTNLAIVMTQKAEGLNEVVVVGYGTSRKRDLTGSVASVTTENIDKTPVFGTSQLLQGQASGVQVTQTNSQPGASFTVRVRGTNSISSSSDPLYVVDGYAGADIGALNPNDIASMEVLKDASSTAIYGSRGANGVIIITTKRGAAGKNVINYDTYYGVQQVGNKLDLMDATQFATYLNQVAAYGNLPARFTQAEISKLGKGTDWQDALFRKASIINHNLSFSGGNADSRHFLSFNYFGQDGIILNSGYKRGSVRFNLDKKISNEIRIGFNSQATYEIQDLANVNTNGGSTGGTLLDALLGSPTTPIYDSAGNFTFQNTPLGVVVPLGNPIAAATLNKDKVRSLRLFANAYGEYEIIKNLRLRTSFGAEIRDRTENIFRPNTTYLGLTTNGYAQIAPSSNYNWLNENTVTYDKTFSRIHSINAVGGFTYQEWKNNSSSATAQSLSSNSYGSDNLSVGGSASVGSNVSKNTLASFFGRINYRLLDKYLFTFTTRADGSSRFGANTKWGYFPSGAFAWRISDENFMKNSKTFSDLKLRVSYGITGNQEIGSYNSLTQYGTNSYQLNGTRVVGISPNNIANADLGWESTASFDAGIDVSVLKGRITFTGDYYRKKTTNLLYSVTLPSSSGFTTMLQNIGSVMNKGVDLSINSINISQKNIRWTTALNFSRNINEVLSLGKVSYQLTGNVSSSVFPGGQNSSILQVGQPIGSFYGYVFDGIWQNAGEITKSGTKQAVKPGDPRYRDLNGDSALTAGADKTIIGHALPKFTYGLTNNFTYKRFNLFILIQGVYGADILNVNRIELENGTTNTNKFAYVATNSWTGDGTSNTLGSVGSTYRRGLGVTSDIVEDGSYMRVKTMTLSYDLPLPKLTNVFKSASLYITGQNLITVTNYSGYDPEVNSYANSAGNYTSLNTDYNPYPNVKTYIVGLKLGF